MTVEVSAALIFRRGKLLITQRYADAHLGGFWEFPGGKREAGESFADCLKRELAEELGIEVEVGDLVQTVRHNYPEKEVLLQFYQCKWIRNEPRTLGCPDFSWVTREQLAGFKFPEADAQLVHRLISDGTLWNVV